MFVSPAKPRAAKTEISTSQAARLGLNEQARRAALLRLPARDGAETPRSLSEPALLADNQLTRLG